MRAVALCGLVPLLLINVGYGPDFFCDHTILGAPIPIADLWGPSCGSSMLLHLRL